MGMVVKNNMSAVRTLNTLNSNTNALQKSLQKVSSGMKINSAQDDASGYAISERMRVRIRSLDQANQNAQNDSSLMKTAEGAVGNTVEILRALKEKAINAANDSNTDEDRQTIQKEINQFIDQIDDNALVQFNGKYLVDGSKNNAFYETKSILLNQSLQTDTSSASALTDLANRAGDSLGIQDTDKYQVSWVQNGTINFTSGTVGSKSISEILTIKGKVPDEDTGELVSGNISQVKATDSSGLISDANEEVASTALYTITTEDAADLASTNSSQDAQDLFAEYKAYCEDTSHGVSLGQPVKLNEMVDANGDRLYSSDGATGDFGNDVYIQEDPNNAGKYFLNITEDTEIYAYNPPEMDSHTEVALTTDGTWQDPAGVGETFSDLTSGDALSTITLQAGITLGNITIPDNAENIAWSITDNSDNSEVAASAVFFYKDSSGGANDGKFKFAKDAGASSVYGSGVTISVTYDTPKAEETSVEENGLEKAWDKFGKAVYTPDKTEGIAFGSTVAGVNYQISGLTISILDQDGNVKKAANAALDQFKQYQRAENETGDMSLNFHIGSEANVAIKVGMGDMRSEALGLKGSDGKRIDVYTKEHANAAINVIENALTKALDQQTTIGAIEARLEYTSTNLTTSSENVQAAESTIRDADMAKEMTNYTKSNVLLQAAQAMLAQANQNSSAVLSLLQ